MANRQPTSTASAQQPVGRVEALGPAVDLDRDAVLAGRPRRPPPASNSDSGRRAAVAGRPAGRCSARGCRRAGWRPPPPSGRSSARRPSAAWSARWRPRRRAGRAGRRPGRASRRRGCRPRCRSGCGTAPAPRSARRRGRAASRSRSADSPLATVSRGEWSVSAMYSWPRSRAASAISSVGLPPSDQSECVWQSPRSAARSAVGSDGRRLRRAAAPGSPAPAPRGRLGDDLGGGRADARAAPAACPRASAAPARPPGGRRPPAAARRKARTR